MSSSLRMVLVGDTYVQRPDPDSVFAPNRARFEGADVFFCNLETVVADADYAPTPLYPAPRTDEAVFDSYLRAGINVFGMANNPSTYHGVDTLVHSLEVLDKLGVAHAGAGRDLAEARRPAIIERNGTKIAFLCRTSVGVPEGAATPTRAGNAFFRITTSYESHIRLPQAPGTPPIVRTSPHPDDTAALAEDLAYARSQADVVVLYWHWGLSISSDAHGELVDYQKQMGRWAIEHGADLVAGGHCHELQPIEVYQGKVIAYGMGNHMHDMMPIHLGSSTGMMLQCEVRDGQIVDVSFVPGWSGPGSAPAIFRPPAEVPEVVELMQNTSAEFGTKFDILPDAVRVVLPEGVGR